LQSRNIVFFGITWLTKDIMDNKFRDHFDTVLKITTSFTR